MNEIMRARHNEAMDNAEQWAKKAGRTYTNDADCARMTQAWVAIAREIRESSREQ